MTMIESKEDALYRRILESSGTHLVIILSHTCPDCHAVHHYVPILTTLYPNLSIHVFNRTDLSTQARFVKLAGVPAFFLYREKTLLDCWHDPHPKPFIDVKAFIDTNLAKEG